MPWGKEPALSPSTRAPGRCPRRRPWRAALPSTPPTEPQLDRSPRLPTDPASRSQRSLETSQPLGTVWSPAVSLPGPPVHSPSGATSTSSRLQGLPGPPQSRPARGDAMPCSVWASVRGCCLTGLAHLQPRALRPACRRSPRSAAGPGRVVFGAASAGGLQPHGRPCTSRGPCEAQGLSGDPPRGAGREGSQGALPLSGRFACSGKPRRASPRGGPALHPDTHSPQE